MYFYDQVVIHLDPEIIPSIRGGITAGERIQSTTSNNNLIDLLQTILPGWFDHVQTIFSFRENEHNPFGIVNYFLVQQYLTLQCSPPESINHRRMGWRQTPPAQSYPFKWSLAWQSRIKPFFRPKLQYLCLTMCFLGLQFWHRAKLG